MEGLSVLCKIIVRSYAGESTKSPQKNTLPAVG